MAGGRQERTDGPAGRGGPHPKGRNEEEDPAEPGCGTPRRDHRAATPTRQIGAGGTSASAGDPRYPQPGAKRRPRVM